MVTSSGRNSRVVVSVYKTKHIYFLDYFGIQKRIFNAFKRSLFLITLHPTLLPYTGMFTPRTSHPHG